MLELLGVGNTKAPSAVCIRVISAGKPCGNVLLLLQLPELLGRLGSSVQSACRERVAWA